MALSLAMLTLSLVLPSQFSPEILLSLLFWAGDDIFILYSVHSPFNSCFFFSRNGYPCRNSSWHSFHVLAIFVTLHTVCIQPVWWQKEWWWGIFAIFFYFWLPDSHWCMKQMKWRKNPTWMVFVIIIIVGISVAKPGYFDLIKILRLTTKKSCAASRSRMYFLNPGAGQKRTGSATLVEKQMKIN